MLGSGKWSSWFIVVFMVVMMVSFLVPAQYAGLMIILDIAAMLGYVLVSNIVPLVRSSGRPFLLINMRTGVAESQVIFKRIKKTEGGMAIHDCEEKLPESLKQRGKQQSGNVGNGSRIGVVCVELDDEPFLYTFGPDKVVLVLPEEVEVEDLFDYTHVETDFGLRVSIRLANMRGVHLGGVREVVEENSLVCRLFKKRCVREVENPIIGVTWTRLDDIAALKQGTDAVRRRFSKDTVEKAKRWVDRLGRIHLSDVEKQALVNKVMILRDYIAELKRMIYEKPQITLSRTQVFAAEEGEGLTESKWVWMGLGAGVTLLVVAVLAAVGVI